MKAKSLFDGINPLDYQSFGELRRNIVISPDKKLLYLSVPKCGCSSVKVFLRALYGQPLEEAQRNPHSTDDQLFIQLTNPETVREELESIFATTRVYSFATIRDPRTRILSAYLNKFKDSRIDVDTKAIFGRQLFGNLPREKLLSRIADLSFEDFLAAVSLQQPLQMNEHWRPITSQLFGIGQETVDLFDISDMESLFERIISDYPYSPLRKDFKFSPHSTNACRYKDQYFNEAVESLFLSIYAADCDLHSSVTRNSNNVA